MTNYQINEMNAEVAQQFGKLIAERDELKAKLAERQKFKDWVHAYLDAHGVPNHPPGTHGEHGCRIGDRMDWLMAKLTDSEREREALQKAHDLLNKGFEAATEQMHELKQTVRSLEHEAAALRHGPTPQEWEAVQAKLAAMREALLEEYKSCPSCRDGVPLDWHAACVRDYKALATDAGQPILDYIAAARRLREAARNLSEAVTAYTRVYGNDSCLVDVENGNVKIKDCIAGVDAAEAKLTGGTA